MSSIPLQIVLHGLIALVPMNEAGGANRMTALLVDAREEPPGVHLQCFAPHVPTVAVTSKTTAPCIEAGCKVSGKRCTCTLDRQTISLSIDPPLDLAKKQLPRQPQSSLPFDQESARDFSYVANLTQPPLNRRLDQRFLVDTVPPEGLVARMEFPFDEIKICSFSARKDEGSSNVHALGFRRQGTSEKRGDVSQALAQQVATTLTVPEERTVTLTISNFGEDNEHTLILDPDQDDTGRFYSVELTNMRPPEWDLLPGDPCDDGIGRDFAFFYELVEDKPAWEERPIPHIKYTRWKSSRDLEFEVCVRRTHAPSSRPICPMASFN